MAINEKYSHKSFKRQDLTKLDASEFNDSEIIHGMFCQEKPWYEVVLHGFDHFAPDKLVHYYAHDRGFDICGQRGHKKDKEIVEQEISKGKPVSYMRVC